MSTYTPEQVRELVEYITQGSQTLKELNRANKWLYENPIEPEPVVVGISDMQVMEFVDRYGYGMVLRSQLREWLLTQTFTQPPRMEPDWDNVSAWDADLCKLQFAFFSENGVIHVIDIAEFNRPVPHLEVGQVWGITGEYDAISGVIIALNDKDVVYQNEFSKGFNVYSIKDFIAKFEKVN